MKSKINLNTILFAFCIIGIAGSYYMSLKNKTKAGYIVIEDVFNEFEFKKEMTKKYEQVKTARKKVLDSLVIDLTVLSKRVQSGMASKEDQSLFERYRAEYAQKKQMFDEDDREMTRQYDKEIITQLNQYVKDYGTEHHYDIILGNNSDGSLMYGDEKHNITNEVSRYINDKYKGVK